MSEQGKNANQSDERPPSGLLEQLRLESVEPRAYSALYIGHRGTPTSPLSVIASLGLNRDALSDRATDALDAIEELAVDDPESSWTRFKWKLSAFSYLQDAFDTPALHPVDVPILFEQYYFYFESRGILAESVLAGLNGLYSASSVLLRPFLEFSLLQNYYYRRSRSESSYKPIIDYFDTHRAPAQATMMRKALPNDRFSKPIRFRAQAHLTALSQSSSHPYHPESSPGQHRPQVGAHSLEGLFFWHSTNLILESALWVYYVNFPLLFNRIDIVRKFGYNEPVGVGVHEHAIEFIRQSLNGADFEAFKEYADNDETARSVRDWIADRPDLTDAQIRATWSPADGELTDTWEGYCKHMSKLRATRMAMAFRLAKDRDIPDRLMDAMKSLEGWGRIIRASARK